MPLFGSRSKRFEDIVDVDDLHVAVKEDRDGYIFVSANGVFYGKTKPHEKILKGDGYMIINEELLKTELKAEALIVLMEVSSGQRSETAIAKAIIAFRQYQKKK